MWKRAFIGLVFLVAQPLFGQVDKTELSTTHLNTFGLDTLDRYEWTATSFTKSGSSYRLDSIYYEDYDVATQQWLKQVSTLFIYGATGITQETIRRAWDMPNSSWLNQTRYVDSLEDGQRKFRMQYTWDNSESKWIPSSRNFYQRDSIGNILYFLQQLNTLQEWTDHNQKIYQYDSLGNRIELISQDYTGSSWLNNYRYLYAYSSDTLTSYTDQYWNQADSTWNNSTRFLYDYYSNGLRWADTIQSWNTTNGWVPLTLVKYYWTVDNLISEKVYQTWDINDTLWNNAASYLYSQNGAGSDTLIVYRYWYGFWKELNQYKYAYGTGGMLVEELWQEWDEPASNWLNDYRVTYYRTMLPVELSVNIFDSTTISCAGLSDGTASAFASGGLPPYQYQWDDDLLTSGPDVENLSPGRYYRVVVTDATLNTAVDSLMLSDPDSVLTGPISGDTVAFYNDTLTYSVMDTAFYFEWTVTGGYIMTGQGTNIVQIVWDNEPEGLIIVMETDTNGCVGAPVYLQVSLHPLSNTIVEQDRTVNQ